ncbi:MAG TPA: ShlB/FhaC/HecB family hemolysin secretion/activation protein [Methyloradius sp.]
MATQAYAATIVPPTPGAIQDSVQDRRSPDVASPAQIVFTADDTEGSPDQPDSSKRFLVSGFTFTGNTVFSEFELRNITEQYLDLQLTLAEIDRIAAKITAIYRSEGYTVARAFVPAQRVDDGLVTIQIIEGKISNTGFKGQWRYRKNFLQPYFDDFIRNQNGQLVTDTGMERQLLLLNDLPGLKARATLVPGESFGTTDINVDLKEKLFDAFVGYSNPGSRETGENRIDAGASVNNPFTLGDQLTLRAIQSTDDLFKYQRVGYSFPIGSNGIRLALSTLNTDYKLGGNFSVLDISGKVRSSDVTVSYPFIRTRSRNIIGALQYRRTSTEQNVLGAPFSNSSLPLTVASVYSNWVHDDSSATSLNVAYSTNLWRNGSIAEQNHVASKVDAEVTHLTGATRYWDFFFRGQGVYSASALPDTEKFSLGGSESIRGYPVAEVRGDEGYLITMELRRQWRLASVPGYFSVFADTGGVKTKGFLGTDRLSSVGAGMVFYLGNYGRFKAEYAVPTSDDKAADGKSGRLWFNLNLSY